MNTPGYESLASVLLRAYNQAAHGKGAERHACDRPFTEQPMQSISGLLGSHTGLLYQAMKKVQESERLDVDAQIRELLGAINYIAGAVIFIEAKKPSFVRNASTGLTTHWVCSCGHEDCVTKIGEACAVCGTRPTGGRE